MSLDVGSDLMPEQPDAAPAQAERKPAIDPASIIIRPTYDHAHYLRRAQLYTKAAEYEPDPGVQAALRWCANECRRRADELKARN